MKEITVAKAQKLHGLGTQIHWRPDGKVNPSYPETDLCFLITEVDKETPEKSPRHEAREPGQTEHPLDFVSRTV